MKVSRFSTGQIVHLQPGRVWALQDPAGGVVIEVEDIYILSTGGKVTAKRRRYPLSQEQAEQLYIDLGSALDVP